MLAALRFAKSILSYNVHLLTNVLKSDARGST